MIREFAPICPNTNCQDPQCNYEHVCLGCLQVDFCVCCCWCDRPDCEHAREDEA